jgi:hypothetical protein
MLLLLLLLLLLEDMIVEVELQQRRRLVVRIGRCFDDARKNSVAMILFNQQVE